ncbi:MAG: hypothetical protein HY831_00760 [Candidatus Aenigmarchaeota archaeon]|nr:hypothetical protein [Candidatus Aenigmarchaeota archaeon]
MAAKNVRNAIIALILLGVGTWFLLKIGRSFSPKDSPIDFVSLFSSLDNVINFFLFCIIVLVIILIPVWISKYRDEKKQNVQANKPLQSAFKIYFMN